MESYNYEQGGCSLRYWMKQEMQQQIHDSPVRHVTVTVTTEVTDGSLRFPSNDQGLGKGCLFAHFSTDRQTSERGRYISVEDATRRR
jgi:hypothetical protein